MQRLSPARIEAVGKARDVSGAEDVVAQGATILQCMISDFPRSSASARIVYTQALSPEQRRRAKRPFETAAYDLRGAASETASGSNLFASASVASEGECPFTGLYHRAADGSSSSFAAVGDAPRAPTVRARTRDRSSHEWLGAARQSSTADQRVGQIYPRRNDPHSPAEPPTWAAGPIARLSRSQAVLQLPGTSLIDPHLAEAMRSRRSVVSQG